MFTREAKVTTAAAVALVALGFLASVALPALRLYRAELDSRTVRIRAHAEAEADAIRAMGFWRADSCYAGATDVLLEVRRIEAEGR